MRVETTPLENRVLKVVVEATQEETETARRTAAQKLGKQIRVPGFRPGKAPYPILLKHLDPALLQEETIEVFLDKAYPEILENEKIEPSGQGRLESIHSIDPIKLEILVPLEPLVELGDYHSIRIPYEPPTVSEEDIDKALEPLRQQNAVIEPVERPIQEGDVVYIDLVGYRKEKGEVTSQVIVEKQDLLIQILEENRDGWEYPFSGFSRVLIGRQINDEFRVDFSYSEDAPSLEFKGVDVHFEGTIKEIKARVLPELNDEFAQSIGEYTSLEELRNSIRSILEEQALANYLEEYDHKVLQEVINRSKIEYPPEMAERERKAYLKELSQRLGQLKIDLELYKKIRGISEEQFEEEVNQAVDYRIKYVLTLLEIAKVENIRIDPLQVRENVHRAVQNFREKTKNSRIPEQLLRDVASQITEQHMMDQVLDGAFEKLRQIAKGEVSGEIMGGTEKDIPTDLAQSELDKTDEVEIETHASEANNTSEMEN